MRKELGYEVATFIRTPAELTAIAVHNPFPKAKPDGGSLYIGFVTEPFTPETARMVQSFKSAVDDFQVRDREVYWRCRVPSHESRFSLARFERALHWPATFCNATTIRKLAQKYPPPK